MRSILVTVLGGCLLGLIIGCDGRSNQVELPKNPTPPPKTGLSPIGGIKSGGRTMPAMPSPEARPTAPSPRRLCVNITR